MDLRMWWKSPHSVVSSPLESEGKMNLIVLEERSFCEICLRRAAVCISCCWDWRAWCNINWVRMSPCGGPATDAWLLAACPN